MPPRSLRVLRAHPWLVAALAVVVAGGVAGLYLITRGAGGTASATTTSRLVAVSRGTVRASVSTTGTLSPDDEKDVSFGSSGKVIAVRVSVGDKVKKGDLLGRIDRVSLRAALAQDRATLASAKAQLASARVGTSSTSAQRSADKASVRTARSSLRAADKALHDARLRAPISGTVAAVNVSKGDEVGSGDGSDSTGDATTNGNDASSTSTSTSGDSADFVVIGGRKWTVSATVDDTQVDLVAKHDQVQITTDASSTPVFGTVRSVSVMASSTSTSASYPVDIAVTGSPSGLHDGAAATASIIYKQHTNVLTVSTAAIHSDGSTKYVDVDDNGRQVKRTVRTGLSSGGTTEITSGLRAGEQVYVETVTLPTARSSGSTDGSRFGTGSGGYTGGFPGDGQFPGGGGLPAGNGGGGS